MMITTVPKSTTGEKSRPFLHGTELDHITYDPAPPQKTSCPHGLHPLETIETPRSVTLNPRTKLELKGTGAARSFFLNGVGEGLEAQESLKCRILGLLRASGAVGFVCGR